MLGNIVNTIAIVAGSLLGLLFRGRVSERYERHIIHAMALAVLLIGLQGALKVENPLVMLLSLAVGAVLGEWIDVEARLEGMSNGLKRRFKLQSDGFADAFVTATLLYCVGSLAIVGALQGGLQGDHSTLIAKGVIDGIVSLILSSTMGIGIIFAALPTFIYQGSIVLAAQFLAPLLTDAVIADLSTVGSVLIIGMGLNMLGLTRLRIGNYLPAIVVAPVIGYLLDVIFKVFA